MNRRTYLGAVGSAGVASLAGCSGLIQTRSINEPPLAEYRPNAVYIPTHVEEMAMAGMGSIGELKVGLMYSYPHRFWTVENEDGAYVTKKQSIRQEDSVHLMATPFDPETGMVIPDTGLSVEITKDGSLVSQEVIYPMLSQRMGFHYGANFPLDGDGAYTVSVSVGGVSLTRFGAFEGRFSEPSTTDVEFAFSQSERDDLSYELLDDRAGERGALSPMEMGMVPIGRAPDSLPGTSMGTGTSADARVLTSVVSADRFGPDPYLCVSPRTPHNGLVIPRMGLDATVERDGTTVYDDALEAALDPDLGYHYGASVPDLRAEDDLTLSVPVPPQVARHEGYETAFLSFDSLSV